MVCRRQLHGRPAAAPLAVLAVLLLLCQCAVKCQESGQGGIGTARGGGDTASRRTLEEDGESSSDGQASNDEQGGNDGQPASGQNTDTGNEDESGQSEEKKSEGSSDGDANQEGSQAEATRVAPPPPYLAWDDFGMNPIVIEIPEGKVLLPRNPKPRDAGRPRRVVFNYARRCCEVSQFRNCASALKHGADICMTYNESALSPAFVKRNKGILDLPRGGGYWIWKPYLILKVLTEMDEGDILVYSDAAQEFVQDMSPLTDYVMGEQSILIGKAQWYHNDGWTKRDCFLLMGCLNVTACGDGYQVQASTFVFRKNEFNLAFAAKWLAYAQDARVITDLGNTLGQPNLKEGTWHRHDQSIVSLMTIMMNLKTIDAYPDDGGPMEFLRTIWHHRIRM